MTREELIDQAVRNGVQQIKLADETLMDVLRRFAHGLWPHELRVIREQFRRLSQTEGPAFHRIWQQMLDHLLSE